MSDLEAQIADLQTEIYDLESDRDYYACQANEYDYEISDLQDQIRDLQDQVGQSSFNDVAQEIWETCDEKGFHDPVDPEILTKALRLLLIVGELAEALEAMRKGDEENHREEIADTLIRLLHYGACEGIDLDAEVQQKMEVNRGRPHKHGKKF